MKLSLPENICRLRKENGLTQERLAEVLGVSFAAVSKWERGAATPELGLIAEMAELFGVSIDALIGKTLASDCDDPDAALPYLSMALLDLSVTHMQLVMGYANVYLKTGNYPDALALLEWALDYYPGLRRPGRPNFLDKGEAALWALRAYAHMRLGEEAKAAASLRRAAGNRPC